MRVNYTNANRLAWNEAMKKYHKKGLKKAVDIFGNSENPLQKEPELSALKTLGTEGKSIAHLCCNNGLELLSLKRMGAGNCTGFDISDEAILAAKQTAERFNISCEFVQSNIYDIPEKYNATFDIVYITVGCLGWMPDLTLFFNKAHQLLKREGFIFIYEMHPFTELFPTDSDNAENPLTVSESYFKSKPYEENEGIHYLGQDESAELTKYWFVHKFSTIITAIIENNLFLHFFEEYEQDISLSFQKLESRHQGVPLSYILICKKIEKGKN